MSLRNLPSDSEDLYKSLCDINSLLILEEVYFFPHQKIQNFAEVRFLVCKQEMLLFDVLMGLHHV